MLFLNVAVIAGDLPVEYRNVISELDVSSTVLGRYFFAETAVLDDVGLLINGTVYTVILALQILLYLAAFAGYILSEHGKKNKLLYTAYYFVFMNLNVFRGMAYPRTHSNSGAWEKAKRS